MEASLLSLSPLSLDSAGSTSSRLALSLEFYTLGCCKSFGSTFVLGGCIVMIIFTILATNTMGWRDHRKGSYYRMLMNLHSKAIEVIIAPLVRPQAQVQRPVNPGLKRRGPGGAWDLQGPGGQNCSGLPQKMVIHIERVTPDKENGSMVNVTKVVVTKLKLDIGPEGFCLTGRPREGKGC
ncbi:unnamed protein product [Ilex paraguariensis]|uniref:Uncharacterized protein n=1 Tax=Ilex paraguariensis TaxID=185542 RepID=A0ABC8TS38_9AQUA